MPEDPVSRRRLLGGGLASALPWPAVPARWAPPRVPPLVMVDPGHGGVDPGAIGVSGVYEKQITLLAAFELRRQLLAAGRYRVMLTRTQDRFVSLEERVAMAERARADLFVSLHADEIADPAIRGASIYTMSNTASDAQTAALAKSENAADRLAGPGFRGISPEVGQILASLVREETRRHSATLARDAVAALEARIVLLPNPARHARFFVLKAPDIPSVLLEMGFVSNRLDEAALRQPAHRAAIASALTLATGRYFNAVGRGAMLAG
ncbi:MAG: N-acetylmuramoyl-L-alanine amidase family protein [Acetobacteraceae bacterium]